MEKLPLEIVGCIFRFLYKSKDAVRFAMTKKVYYRYFKEHLLSWRLREINACGSLFWRLTRLGDPIVCLADMEGTLFTPHSPYRIPKSVCVWSVFFKHGKIKDLERWWNLYPPDMTNFLIRRHFSRHVNKTITLSKSPDLFAWILHYFERNFVPYDTHVKLNTDTSLLCKITRLKCCLGPISHVCTKNIFSLPGEAFEDYLRIWWAFCHRQDISISERWAIVGSLKTSLTRSKNLLKNIYDKEIHMQTKDLGFILQHSIKNFDKNTYTPSVEFLLDEINNVVKINEGWRSCGKYWSRALLNSTSNRCEAIFDLLMTYRPHPDLYPELTLGGLFNEKIAPLWNTLRITSLFSECKMKKSCVNFCERCFGKYGNLSWASTFVFLLDDTLLQPVCDFKHTTKFFRKMVKLCQPMTLFEKTSLYTALESSKLKENSKLTEKIRSLIEAS